MPYTKGIYSLPLELRSHIVEYLIDDRGSLVALTLTCHGWRGLSQARLFRRISLAGEHRFYELLWLLDARPEAGPWIHELRVSTLGGQLQNDWIYTVPVLLSTRLTALRTLTLRGVRDFARYDGDKFFPYLHPRFPSVRTLNVMHCTLPLRGFVEYVSLFKNLDNLLIEQFELSAEPAKLVRQVGPWDGVVIPPSSCLARLRSFVLDHAFVLDRPFALGRSPTHACPTLNFVRWIGHASSLRTLSLSITKDSDLPNVGRLISALGPSLERLGLGFYGKEGGSNFTDHVDLSSCTSLRAFALEQGDLSLIPLLLQLTSPHLRNVTLVDGLRQLEGIRLPLHDIVHKKPVFSGVEILLVFVVSQPSCRGPVSQMSTEGWKQKLYDWDEQRFVQAVYCVRRPLLEY
ncbi:hypothetical protein BKA93DRAFT_218750 [Sparassis latifolia]